MKRLLIVLALALAVVFALSAYASETKEKAKETTTTLKGELLDMGCYMGHGAMGEKHKDCATKCLAGGMPMGLMVGKQVYLLTMNHDNPDAYNKCKDWASQIVEVTGVVSERSGMKAIDVAEAKPAEMKAETPAK